MGWVEGGDAFTLAKYEEGSSAPGIVAGYTQAEAAALVVDAVDPATPYTMHPPSAYPLSALAFSGGSFLRLGGKNLEDPPGYPQFPKETGKTVAPWRFMPDRRLSLHDPPGCAGIFKLSGAVDGAFFRGYSLTTTKYESGLTWSVVRTLLITFAFHGDGSVSITLPANDATGTPEVIYRSSAGVLPVGRWFRLQITRWGVRIDATTVLALPILPATLEPAPFPLIRSWDFGALEGGSFVVRDLVMGADGWMQNWAVDHLVPTIDLTEQLATEYAADPNNNVKWTEQQGDRTLLLVDSGRLARRPWRKMQGSPSLANGGVAYDEGATNVINIPAADQVKDSAGRVRGYAESGDETHLYPWVRDARSGFYEYPTAALCLAYGWNYGIGGVEWMKIKAERNHWLNDRAAPEGPIALLYTEQHWLDEVPNHNVSFVVGRTQAIELKQERRASKKWRFGYDYFRGQPGLDEVEVTLAHYTSFSSPNLGVRHTIHTDGSQPSLHLQSKVTFANARADVLHQSVPPDGSGIGTPPLGRRSRVRGSVWVMGM